MTIYQQYCNWKKAKRKQNQNRNNIRTGIQQPKTARRMSLQHGIQLDDKQTSVQQVRQENQSNIPPPTMRQYRNSTQFCIQQIGRSIQIAFAKFRT